VGYFEGFYVKCDGREESVAVIFGRNLSGEEGTAFVQIVTEEGSYYSGFDYKDFSKAKKGFGVKVGENSADKDKLVLNIAQDGLRVSGEVKFGNFSAVKYDVMGPLKFLPFMECKHCAVSMRHSIDGRIMINGRGYNFDEGYGYIEGDRGKSFPKKYFWSQCNTFSDKNNPAIFASCAAIPYLGIKFTGTVSVIHFEGREYRLATYLGAKVRTFEREKLVIEQGSGGKRKVLEISAPNAENCRELLAPNNGKMSRTIRESIKAGVNYKFSAGGTVLFDVFSPRAAYEFSE
jgi:hypothetical protein